MAVLGLYAAMSVALFFVYGADKRAARRGGRRTPENVLHLMALGGGWPGALLASRVFRHKTRKQPFRFVFWCTVTANCVALVFAAKAGWLRF